MKRPRWLRHGYIGTEHLLLGVLREEERVAARGEEEGLAARALEAFDITPVHARGEITRRVGRGEETPAGPIPFTPRAKKVLELALEEARALGHNYIGTEHLLLGLLREEEGVAVEVLAALDVDVDKLRVEMMMRLSLADYPTPQLAYDAVTTAPTACTDLQNAGLLASRVPVYAYTFDYQHAPYYFPAIPGFIPLAAHTIDIQFLFPGYHGGIPGVPHSLNAQETRLSKELVAAWTNFALTGNPNRTGSSPWPRFTETPGAPSVLSESIPSLSTQTTAQVSAKYHCAFLEHHPDVLRRRFQRQGLAG